MTDKPSPTGEALSPDCGGDDEHERPTIHPPFDVEAFARAQMTPGGCAELPRPEWLEPERHSGRITITNEVELERAGVGSDPDADSRPTAVPGPIEGPEITESAIDDPVAEMRKCFSREDYAGALGIAELIIVGDPHNLAATGCRENCRVRLENIYAASVRPDRVPVVLVSRARARSGSIDHRAGFMLSLIDGSSTVKRIVDESGMPKFDALRILHELVTQQIVGFA